MHVYTGRRFVDVSATAANVRLLFIPSIKQVMDVIRSVATGIACVAHGNVCLFYSAAGQFGKDSRYADCYGTPLLAEFGD